MIIATGGSIDTIKVASTWEFIKGRLENFFGVNPKVELELNKNSETSYTITINIDSSKSS